MNMTNPGFTKLVPDLKGAHPDEAFSSIPYEKGSLFLRYLEDLVGGPAVFDKFARDYINTYSKKSLDSFEFKEYFMKYFESNPKVQEVKWDDWFYTEGMPPVIPDHHSLAGEGKLREETCIPKRAVVFEGYVKSANPHWASVVDYGLNTLMLRVDPSPSMGTYMGCHEGSKNTLFFDSSRNYLTFIQSDSMLNKSFFYDTEYDTSMITDVVKVLEKILTDDALESKDVAKFSPPQVAYLLEMLLNKAALNPQRLSQLGEAYGVSTSPNSEIKFLWYRLNIKSRKKEILVDVFEFLSRVGRMKYCRPLYRDLYAWEEVRQQAIDHFLRTEPTMMHVVSYTLRIDLHLKAKDTE